MANQQGSGGAGLVFAFLAGAAVGAAVALLVAPATGEDTRERLGQRVREGRDRAADAARQGRELLNRQREQVSTAFDRVRQQYQGAPETGEEQDA
jgi:gas vesicle protein